MITAEFKDCTTMKGAIAMMLVAMTTVSCKQLSKRATDERKVVIVGAGIAGIAAAKTLHENGVDDFVILEGSDRIGGRMKQVEFGGVKVEVGANWVHGRSNNNPIWELVQKYSISGKESNYDDFVVRNKTGNDVTDQAEAQTERLSTAQDYLENWRGQIRNDTLPDVSLEVALKLGGWKAKTPLERILEYFDYEFEYADPAEVTSLNNTGRVAEDFSDEDYFVTDQRGFGHIVDRLSNEFLSPNDPRLQLNKVVETVNWTDHTEVTFTTTDGSIYRGEYGLMTVSIGVLENEVIDFIPDLPDWKVEEIYQFRMGQHCKIFLKFPHKFWDDSEYIMYAGSFWPQYAIWQNLEAPGFFPTGTNILMVSALANEVQAIELQSDEETKQEVMAVLKNMYGDNIPEPESILVPRWLTDPLFFGAYSNWPVHVNTQDFEKLAAPVGRLYFGGEATHAKYNGYLQGGYLSGIDQANVILNCMQNGICESYKPVVSRGTPGIPAPVFVILVLPLVVAMFLGQSASTMMIY
ncbi:polyamine oxidase 1-like [Branchiostoma floridae]|uniref:Amine oxidase n=1 Tax=Branchiostoma floridae TaxID=7739 RepID=A0A9J7LQX4_BRAFL|nr:polyamine oxidase 1-like [Branchiostoma floridae]